MSAGANRYRIDEQDRCWTDDDMWAPRPSNTCGCCRGTGYGEDPDGHYRCDCELYEDAEARDTVLGDVVEVLTLGYQQLGFTMPSGMAECEAARQLESGALDDQILARIALNADRARMQRLDRDRAADYLRERRHVREIALKVAGGGK